MSPDQSQNRPQTALAWHILDRLVWMLFEPLLDEIQVFRRGPGSALEPQGGGRSSGGGRGCGGEVGKLANKAPARFRNNITGTHQSAWGSGHTQ